ncbi:MAG: 2-oxoacid:acceptor oxidoreductase family protein [Thermoproteales archaeon]|nr:2-oxoacid:acceptor oxidoreductase family protein [Thermoproteales archaeon]
MALIEVRWHGRGGQGVVTASDLLAKAAILEGKYVWHAPMFGPERTGAPVMAFTRISDEPIEIHSGIYSPDIVVTIDPIQVVEVEWYTEGLKEGGSVVVNAKKIPKVLADKAVQKNYKIFYVDAYDIALNVFKRAFYNTPMLGALVKVTGIVGLESVLKVVEARFRKEIAEKNKEAIRKAYEEVKKYE